MPTVSVEINDEGKYGRAHYTDDPYVDEPVYEWHEGKYDMKALVEEVGSWNEMIATTFGALKDVMCGSGVEVVAPITEYQNFEQLEFKGRNSQHLGPFLNAMKELADKEKEEPHASPK